MSMQSVPILEMFPCLAQHQSFCGGLERAEVSTVLVDQESFSMQVTAQFARTPLSGELRAMEATLCGEFGLATATIHQPAPPEKKPEVKAPQSTLLYGRQFKSKPVEISSLTAESGNVVIQGEVFAVENREITKRKAMVLSFDVTDGTSSIRVSRFIPSGEDQSIAGKIEKGMYLTIQGSVSYNRYDEDITLEPRSILKTAKAVRQDTAPEKRVELHLHTRFSALDALTDPTAAVKRAAQWGHPAIAITDHGVAQSFPEVWEAGKKNKIKILFGLEGYYINDVDDRLAVHGESTLPLDTEFVAFDIETTGLEPDYDRITEIGAAIFREGVIVDRFSTMVNPGVPIPPEIVELTGITDRDVYDAPDAARAMRDFLAFAGDRPLIAHNADFDVGFMDAACRRAGIPFAPVYLDSLVIAQCLLPDMRRHKLDLVAARLGLPDFNHHRALDDGLTVAHMMGRFLPMLRELGCETVGDIEPRLRALRQSRSERGQTRHIILLVKNKVGLKNLYELISKSHLEHFRKNPIIPKSLLLQHREGLIIGSACEAGEVFRALVDRKGQAELRRIAGFYDYLEIQPICNNAFMVREGKAKDDEALREYNRRIVALAESLG